MLIGVLALQGAYAKHVEMIEKLHAKAKLVKTPNNLDLVDALIIPGGESTVQMDLIHRSGLFEPLQKFAHTKPIFGTCAGAILLATRLQECAMPTLSIMDITVRRNAYGTQIESFKDEILFNQEKIPAIFIRAPVIEEINSNISILATYKETPILVQQGLHLAATFHPELSNNLSIHKYFINKVINN